MIESLCFLAIGNTYLKHIVGIDFIDCMKQAFEFVGSRSGSYYELCAGQGLEAMKLKGICL